MKNLSDLSFTVPLNSSAHYLAEQFCRQQSTQKKAKQVYLNTLAVSAVNFYLRCMGIETDWEASQSLDFVQQSIMDVAGLEIPNLGKLECRFLLPADKIVYIPSEVWSDRIGYVAVQFDQLLKVATLLGFSPTAGNGELAINQLRSLEDLLDHLRQLPQTQPIKLSQWFENLFETGWQSLSALLGTNHKQLDFSFRSASRLSDAHIQRAKLIDLGVQLSNQSVVLLVAIAPETEQKVSIIVQVHPMGEDKYLPPNIRLSLLSELEDILQEVVSRNQDNYIQLRQFRGTSGEGFKVKIACENTKLIETFEI